jgi:ABC-type Fe3+-hydroxamate transport system, periplasmic component
MRANDRAYLRERRGHSGGLEIRRDAIVAVVGAGLGFLVPERLTLVHPALVSLVSAVLAVVIFEGAAYIWRFVWIAPRKMHFDSLKSIDRLELERNEAYQRRDEALKNAEKRRATESERDTLKAELSSAKLALVKATDLQPRIISAFRREGNEIFLDVSNSGSAGEFWAEVSARGSINPMDRRRGVWVRKNYAGPQFREGYPERIIPKGDQATILVATLDIDTVAIGLFGWQIWYYAHGLMYPLQPQRSHGFGPEGVADPDISIEVVIAAKPDAINGVTTRRMRIRKFTCLDAESGSEIT